MNKIDCVWLGVAVLTYDVCRDKKNWKLDDIYFSQQDIIKAAEAIVGNKVPNAFVSQHAVAYSNSQNRNCMYLVAREVKRRISYIGEFEGKTERPDFSEMKNNITVSTKHGEIKVAELNEFVEEEFTPRIKRLLEEHFSKYDLGSVLDYVDAYKGKKFVAVEKAGDQAQEMSEFKNKGSAARLMVKEFGAEVKAAIPRFDKQETSGWRNQGQRVEGYIWSELKKQDKEKFPTSIFIFFERIGHDADSKAGFRLRISVEARDSKCVGDEESSAEKKYFRHNRLLNVPKTNKELHYFIVDSSTNEFGETKKSADELKEYVHNTEQKKVQICKCLDEKDVRSLSAYEVYQFLIEAFADLEPYYDAAVADVGSESPMEEEGDELMSTSSYGLNMILYGPPGTGKTYNTVNYAVAICDELTIEEVEAMGYDKVKARYDELASPAVGRITFTTFHQSYGYEEFIEGISPIIVKDDGADGNGDVRYKYKDGVFKAFCKRASEKSVVDSNNFGLKERPRVWNVILGGNDSPDLKQKCFDEETIRIGWENQPEVIIESNEKINDKERRILLNFQDEMEVGDIVVTRAGKTTIDGIGVITGNCEFDTTVEGYPRKRTVNWLVKGETKDILDLNGGTQLDRKSVYPLNRISAADIIKLIPGNTDAVRVENQPYVFVIDEINRGNISKIFGELITLIEDTKRAGCDEQATAVLPYSGEPFSVPSNVYILGTMNTADRSIALMDTALRRRFSFIEKMPEPALLDGVLASQGGASIDVGKMLKTINDRIEFLFDREHTIGHAFFMKLKKNPDIEVLADIFKRFVVPLLQEYFYEDYEKIQLVLGDNGKAEDKYKFIINETVAPSSLFRGRSRLEKSNRYTINDNAFQWIDSYIGIMDSETKTDEPEDEE